MPAVNSISVNKVDNIGGGWGGDYNHISQPREGVLLSSTPHSRTLTTVKTNKRASRIRKSNQPLVSIPSAMPNDSSDISESLLPSSSLLTSGDIKKITNNFSSPLLLGKIESDHSSSPQSIGDIRKVRVSSFVSSPPCGDLGKNALSTSPKPQLLSAKAAIFHSSIFKVSSYSVNMPSSTTVPSRKYVTNESKARQVAIEKLPKAVKRERFIGSSTPIKNFLKEVAKLGMLTAHRIKKAMEKYHLNVPSIALFKPDGNDVHEMFGDGLMFACGEESLPSGRHQLNVKQMDIFHVASCRQCQLNQCVSCECYYFKMRLCITHGWNPPMKNPLVRIEPKYAYKGNSKQVALFPAAAIKQFNDMASRGFMERICPASLQEASSGVHQGNKRHIITPLGLTFKNSDRHRVKALCGGLVLSDQADLDKANLQLSSEGYLSVKGRLTTDASGSGVNGAAIVPPFSYPTIDGILKIIKRNGYLGKGDVSRYFPNFPLAECCLWMFHFHWQGYLWRFLTVFFGFASSPYYTSTWSAEFKVWITFLGIKCAHMVDDWLVCCETLHQAEEDLSIISSTFESVGLEMNEDKKEFGQCLVFLGILWDTVRMTIRFDPIQCKGVHKQLVGYRLQIEQGNYPSYTTINHVCGKLNWYCQVVQSGRMHTNSWWAFMRIVLHRNKLSSKNKALLLEDTDWWINQVLSWSISEASGNEYSIVCADEILELTIVVQSDASGEDGIGLFFGALDEENPKYVAQLWPKDFIPPSSQNGELRALSYFIFNEDCAKRVVVWVSDSQSAVWSINKGRSKSQEDMKLVSRILGESDRRGITLIALWIPREENELADYLSHLCVILNVSEAKGRISELV